MSKQFIVVTFYKDGDIVDTGSIPFMDMRNQVALMQEIEKLASELKILPESYNDVGLVTIMEESEDDEGI